MLLEDADELDGAEDVDGVEVDGVEFGVDEVDGKGVEEWADEEGGVEEGDSVEEEGIGDEGDGVAGGCAGLVEAAPVSELVLALDSPVVWLALLLSIGKGGREWRLLRPRSVRRKLWYLTERRAI